MVNILRIRVFLMYSLLSYPIREIILVTFYLKIALQLRTASVELLLPKVLSSFGVEKRL